MNNFSLFSKFFAQLPEHIGVGIMGLSSRVVMAITQLFSIPIIFKALGVNDYAVFTILCNLIIWFNLLDYGIGYYLQNHLVSLSEADRPLFLWRIRHLILLIAFLNILLVLGCAHLIQLFLFDKFNDVPKHIFLLVGICYGLTTAFSVSYRVLFSRHQGLLAYLFQLFSWVGVGCAILLIFSLKFYTIYAFILCWLIPPLFFALWVFLLAFKKPLSGKAFFREMQATSFWRFVYSVFKRSGGFALFALIGLTITGLDYIVMSQELAAQDIVIYNTTAKLFAFLNTLQVATLSSLYFPLAEAYYKNDQALLKKTLRSAFVNFASCCLILLIATIVFIELRDQVASLLLHKQLYFPILIIFFAFVIGVLSLWNNLFTTFLQSSGQIPKTLLTLVVQGALNIVCMIYLTKHYGLNGIYAALILSTLFTAAWIYPLISLKTFRFVNANNNQSANKL